MILLAQIYRFFGSLHRALYELGILKKVKLNKPVLSVGNLSMGGTGKTPFTLFLFDELVKRNKRPAIICRSYKATLNESKEVFVDADPVVVGDEAVYFKTKRPSAVVISGPVKLESAKIAAQMQNIDVILVDDGFQHHKLYKDWNGIVLDLSKSANPYFREYHSALKYASCLLLSRSVNRHISSLIPQFHLESHLKLSSLKTQKCLLVSAIGNPQQLADGMKNSFPEVEFQEVRFSDHHQYTQEDVVKIEKQASENQISEILCTEKDFVKIKKLKFNSQIWQPLEQLTRVTPSSDWDQYFAKVCQELKL